MPTAILAAFVCLSVIAVFVIGTNRSQAQTITNSSTTFTITAFPHCNDGINNDGEGGTDYQDDCNCESLQDTSEDTGGDCNEPPVAGWSPPPSEEVVVGDRLTFDAGGSYDPDGSDSNLSYDWNTYPSDEGISWTLDDSTGVRAENTFDLPGTNFTIGLIVTDGGSATSSPELTANFDVIKPTFDMLPTDQIIRIPANSPSSTSEANNISITNLEGVDPNNITFDVDVPTSGASDQNIYYDYSTSTNSLGEVVGSLEVWAQKKSGGFSVGQYNIEITGESVVGSTTATTSAGIELRAQTFFEF